MQGKFTELYKYCEKRGWEENIEQILAIEKGQTEALLQVGTYTRALTCIERALSLPRGSVDFLLATAQIFIRRNEIKEAKDVFFSIRLWDQGALIDEIFKYYDKFDDELKAELPLKRIWGLVVEE